MLQKLTVFLLAAIVLLGGVIRFYNIDKVPVSLYWDEAASTYNAYSIAYTGKDEYGTWFPVLFRSFDDYKMSGNIYVTALLVRLFGLNEFSARASSSFFGTLTILVTFFLVREILKMAIQQKKKESLFLLQLQIPISLLSAALLAISPWHIQFSRTGFEANVGLFFLVLGIWLLVKGLKQSKYLFFSALVFVVSLYMYRSIQVFLPLFLLGFIVIFRNDLRTHWKTILVASIVAVVLLIPLIPHMISKGGLARARQVNVFSNSFEKVYEAAKKQNEANNSLVSKIIHNRRVVYMQTIAGNYVAHFGPQFLFMQGDGNGRHGVMGMGLLYYFEAPFLLLGLYVLFRFFPSALRNLILVWIVAAPVAASFSVPSPHALRTLNLLPIPQVLVALGIVYSYVSLKHSFRIAFVGIALLIGVASFAWYLNLYYYKTANQVSEQWADGYKQAVIYVMQHEADYDQIIMSGHYWQPYMYMLFYKQYDPRKFQEQGTKEGFDKYMFGGTSWDQEQHHIELDEMDLSTMTASKRVLIVFSPKEYQKYQNTFRKITEIRNHNGDIVFTIADNQK